MLHCLFFEGTGGESTLVDGFKIAGGVAYYGARLVRGAVGGCDTRPVHIGDGSHLMAARARVPPRPQRHSVQVSYNNADRAPFLTQPDEMAQLYAALRAFDNLANSESMQWSQVLRPGEALLFDNWRSLHGRHAYTGKRTLCGAYINHEDFESRLRTAG